MELTLTSLLLPIAGISRVEGSLIFRTGRPAVKEAFLSSPAATEFVGSNEKHNHSYWRVHFAVPVQKALAGTSDSVENLWTPKYEMMFSNVHHSEAVNQ